MKLNVFRKVFERCAAPPIVHDLTSSSSRIVPSVWNESATSFPPCLAPIGVHESGVMLTGVWIRSPEVTGNRLSIVRYYPSGSSVDEVARTWRQLGVVLCCEWLGISDSVDSELRAVAHGFGIPDDELVAMEALGDPPIEEFRSLPSFEVNTPRGMAGPDEYDGDLPASNAAPEEGRPCIGFELEGSVRRQLEKSETDSDKPEAFRALLDRRDTAAAWCALNSPGWQLADAVAAARTLRDALGDGLLCEQLDAWLRFSRDWSACY